MKNQFKALFLTFQRLTPTSIRAQLFVSLSLLSIVGAVVAIWVPAVLVLAVYLFVLNLLLVRFLGKPLQQLLQLTRHSGFDLMGPAPVVDGRHEYARLARSIYAMANRMRESILEARDQTTRLDEIFNAIGEGVIIVDSKGVVLRMNHTSERWTGCYSVDAGRTLTEVTRSVELGESLRVMVENVRNLVGDKRWLEPALLEAVNLQGTESRVVRAKIVALPRDNKEPIFMIFLFDVTDLHKLQEIRREFFANVSHELKTPIAAIRGYAETLLDMKSPDETTQKFLSVILRNSLELSKLIDEMLTLAGLESGSLPLNIKSYDVCASCVRIMETVAPKAKTAGVELVMDVPPNLSEMQVDPQRFDSVLLNLVDNGIKYNRPGGFVKLSLRENDSEHLIFVEDNGLGIPDSAKLRAFERFYRVDKAHSRLGGGSGLGLAIVKHTIQAHGGQITLRSELGVGTVFSISIPKDNRALKIKKIESVTPF